jgi:hypothetical protein
MEIPSKLKILNKKTILNKNTEGEEPGLHRVQTGTLEL